MFRQNVAFQLYRESHWWIIFICKAEQRKQKEIPAPTHPILCLRDKQKENGVDVGWAGTGGESKTAKKKKKMSKQTQVPAVSKSHYHFFSCHSSSPPALQGLPRGPENATFPPAHVLPTAWKVLLQLQSHSLLHRPSPRSKVHPVLSSQFQHPSLGQRFLDPNTPTPSSRQNGMVSLYTLIALIIV